MIMAQRNNHNTPGSAPSIRAKDQLPRTVEATARTQHGYQQAGVERSITVQRAAPRQELAGRQRTWRELTGVAA
jgi:hypothetical protein